MTLLTLFCFGFAAVWWPIDDVMAPPSVIATDAEPRDRVWRDLDETDLMAPLPDDYRPERAPFALQAGDDVSPYRITSLFLMPEEAIDLQVHDLQVHDLQVPAAASGEATLEAAAGTVEPRGPAAWRYTAPAEPGHYVLQVSGPAGGMLVNVFVKVPYDGAEVLNGYRIGQYETEPYRNNPTFNRPEGFIEVTPALLDVRLSPHFVLGQFLCKQESGWPKYTLVDERLLLKLESLLETMNAQGMDAATFYVMSSFRTPYYNAAIGNETTYSVHLYGGAADIFIDRDRDTHMDDLDGDGAVTTEEARMMANVVEDLSSEAWYAPFIGGLGIYRPAPHRGPFIHVDVRGERTRW